MSSLHVKYLLVGGGLASSEAARAIREIDPQGDLMLVGQEINRPYHRPPLSKGFLRSQQNRASLFTLPPEWFNEHRVQLRTGRRVSHVDAARNCVTLDSGEEISFAKLLIATGASPTPLRVAGAVLPNLFYLRTLEDAEHLQHAIEKARKEGRAHPADAKLRGRATVIGGGLLGIEIAASLAQTGLHVDLALSRAYPWDRLAGEVTGRFMARFLEKSGLTIHAQARATRLEGDGRVQRVVLSTGDSIDCDFAVAAVGIHINKEILRGTPIVAENAILVNARCQTNMPDIYVAGDCAAVLDPLFGKHRMMDHWETAAITGRIAGTNMAGGDARYDAVTHFETEMLGLPIAVWGEAKQVDRRIIRGVPNLDAPGFAEIGVAADGRIAQVIAVGQTSESERAGLLDLVRRRAAVNGNEEKLKDRAIPLPAESV
ncbi:MAG: FAD-dependent oxidoreductase [Planctomycetota bacterium]|nr:FAD-dependent oxidoreductase [Planctomycetota bacterium]